MHKKCIPILIILLVLLTTTTTIVYAKPTRVKGYIKKSGTYVTPHYRSKSDGKSYNNWSTKGNTNPFTIKKGHKKF